MSGRILRREGLGIAAAVSGEEISGSPSFFFLRETGYSCLKEVPMFRLSRLSCLLFLVLALLPQGPLHAQLHAQTPTVVLQDVPSDVLSGEVFHFKVLFKPDLTLTGNGPFVELAVQYRGADCTTLPGPCDGLELVSASALLANGSVPLTAGSTFQKSVFLLPFGSFVPGQPDVEIDVAVKVHAFADANSPLQIVARGSGTFRTDTGC
jgi:hypothetical protein